MWCKYGNMSMMIKYVKAIWVFIILFLQVFSWLEKFPNEKLGDKGVGLRSLICMAQLGR